MRRKPGTGNRERETGNALASPRLMVIGAHPDDCEASAGGLASLAAKAGWKVHFCTLTNGNAGHMEMGEKALKARREREARKAASRVGATVEHLDEPDGRLFVNERTTSKVVGAIRRFRPTVLVTPRVVDYHRDHRYTAQLVLDASFVLSVPLVYPENPPIRVPVILYAWDRFTEGPPFRGDLVFDITKVEETKIRMLLDHESQYQEWLPWVGGDFSVSMKHPVRDESQQTRWVRAKDREQARQYGKALKAKYRRKVEAAEVFQISEYGARLGSQEIGKLLNF